MGNIDYTEIGERIRKTRKKSILHKKKSQKYAILPALIMEISSEAIKK